MRTLSGFTSGDQVVNYISYGGLKKNTRVHEAALAVKVVKSEKCLFDDAFNGSNRECTVGLQPTQAIDVRPKDVGDKANVRTMTAIIVGRIV
jgi:hypothetical protein